MQKIAKLLSLCLSIAIIGGLTGCAGSGVIDDAAIAQEAAQKARKEKLTPQEAIANSTDKLSKARQDDMEFFAPTFIELAKSKLSEARKLSENIKLPSDAQKVVSTAYAMDKIIDQAYQHRANVEKTLAKSLEHKQVLESLGTPKELPEEYQKGLEMQKKLIIALENKDEEAATKGEKELIQYFSVIEATTLKKQYLTKAIVTLEKAKEIDADDLAEKTYAKAEKAIVNARAFIDKNFRDREGVKAICVTAHNRAQHALSVAKDSAKALGLKAPASEAYVLYLESLLEKINGGEIKNLNNKTLSEQTDAIVEMLNKYREKSVFIDQ